MTQLQYQFNRPQVVDFVLNPLGLSVTLRSLLHHGYVPTSIDEQLAPKLLQAIAQLEAVGDLHGAIALSELLHHLESLHALA